MVVTEEFRRALAQWMAEKKVSQSALARAVGTSQPTIWGILNDPEKFPTSTAVAAICEYTGIPLPHPIVPVTDEDLELLERLHELQKTDPARYEAIKLLLQKH